MILLLNKTTLSVNMSKTCNLSTVINTPSEARRDASTVVYYFINFRDDTAPDIVPQWRTLRGAIETIWDLLAIEDLYFLDDLYICAFMSDNSIRRVRHISIDAAERHMRISRVK